MALMVKFCVIQLIVGLVIFNLKHFAFGKSQVPCYFIFGDSLDDNGNNNYLKTIAKANYPPYGIDFPEGPTGRFTNGRNNADFIAEFLGFDSYIPPFAKTKGWDSTNGVNYASGASGILDETGSQMGELFSFNHQLRNHRRVISRLQLLIGSKAAAKEYLAKCLYTISFGNNDYINNYWQPQYHHTSRIYTPTQFAGILIRQYSQQLRTLYTLGARKVAILGVGSLGCVPALLSKDGTCMDSLDNEVLLFNHKIKPLVDELNTKLKDAQFLYVNVTAINSCSLSIPAEIKIGNAPCYKVFASIGDGQCILGQVPCSNRSQYYFWDDFHPTEIANQAFSRLVYSALLPLLDLDPLALGSLPELKSAANVGGDRINKLQLNVPFH